MLTHTIDKPWKISLLTFLVIVGTGLVLVMALNQNVVNMIFQPILQYWSLFLILWQESAGGAIQFIATKSIIAFAHQDPRSGLNLWTYEIDSLSLAAYIIAAISFATVTHRFLKLAQPDRSGMAKNYLMLALAGTILLSFSVSYMTAIAHCAGATWVGFVSAYGFGAEGFELSPIYQWIIASIGAACLGLALFLSAKALPSLSHTATHEF